MLHGTAHPRPLRASGHALDSHTGIVVAIGTFGAGPGVFFGHTVRKIEATIYKLRRGPHGLASFDQFFVGREQFGDGLAVFDAHFNPFLEANDFFLLFWVQLSLKEEFGLGSGWFGGLLSRRR